MEGIRVVAAQGKSSKKARKHKVSKGEHGGGGKVRLTELQKALMGKGAMKRIEKAAKPRKRDEAQSFTSVE
jgi:hypothetical protein